MVAPHTHLHSVAGKAIVFGQLGLSQVSDTIRSRTISGLVSRQLLIS